MGSAGPGSDIGVKPRDNQARVTPASHLPDSISPNQDFYYLSVEDTSSSALRFEKPPSSLPQTCLGEDQKPLLEGKGDPGSVSPSPHPPRPPAGLGGSLVSWHLSKHCSLRGHFRVELGGGGAERKYRGAWLP